MKLENFSPFPNLRFFNTDNKGREFGVLLIKGAYELSSDGDLTVAGTQEPLALTDGYWGELNTSSLRMPSDLVPNKSRADVIVNGVARAPGGAPARSWPCGVRVEGLSRAEVRLRVTGPRCWTPRWGVSERVRNTLDDEARRRVFLGWRLDEPEPTLEVPIRYELAFGGLQARSQKGNDEPYYDADERNPVGRGWIDRELTPADEPRPAPQIEFEDAPIVDPYALYEPAGLGAIPPAWLPRRPLGGTFDEHWRDNVWPNWPEDYSFAYHNSAHPRLIYPDFLNGDETVTLFGLDAHRPERTVRLPGDLVMAEIERLDGGRDAGAMRLDTLLIDVADSDPGRHRVHLTWRATFDHRTARRAAYTLLTGAELAAEPAA